MDESTRALQCEIRVRGQLGQTLLAAFPDIDALRHDGETVLVGTLPDQAALFGVLARIEALGLELLEVRRDFSDSRARPHTSPASPQESGLTAEQASHGYRLLFEQARHVFFFVRRHDGAIVHASAAAETSYGYSRAELLGLTIDDLLAPQAPRLDKDPLENASGEPLLIETVHRRKDGTLFPVEMSSQGSIAAGGDIIVLWTSRELSERKRLEEEVRAFFSLDLDAMVIADSDGRILRINEALHGLEPAQLEGMRFMDFVHQDEAADAAAALERLRRGQEVHHLLTRMRRKDGSFGWVEWQARPHEGRIYALGHDITRRVETQQALASSVERLQALFEQSPAAICIFDRDLIILESNKRTAEILRTEPERVQRFDLTTAVDQSLRPALRCALAGEVGQYDGTYRSTLSDREGWIAARTAPLRGPDGEIEAGILVVTDVTDLRKAEELIERLAFTDVLTGLANRTLLRDRLRKAVAMTDHSGRKLAILALDVGRFRSVLDTFGQAGADRFLQLLAERLKASVRDQDTVARDAHDHFLILLVDPGQASRISDAVQRLMADCQGSWELDGQEFSVSVCVGVAVCPDDGNDADELIQRANWALRKAKAQGPGSAVFFDPEMTSRASEQLRLEAELRRALSEEQFVVHYQPQVNLESGETEGFEALARWQHPERGLLPPSEFIPLAEETGLIVELDRLVLKHACREVSGLSRRLHRSMKLAVNISAAHLCLPDLSKTVCEIASEAGFDLTELEVEVTETAILKDPTAAEHALRELREHGIMAALDDFGTGYSSLSHLQALPIRRLKIDRSFVMSVPKDKGACSIVASVVGLAHNLGCGVIAEGVETAAQLRFLQKEGCDAGQGYYFGRPGPIGEWASGGAKGRSG